MRHLTKPAVREALARAWEYLRRTASRRADRLICNEPISAVEFFDIGRDFLVTTTTGIYLITPHGVTKLIDGFGFGICVSHGRILITLEQYLDVQQTKYFVTQFLSFRLEGERAVDLRVEKTGLPGSAHYLREFNNVFYFPHGPNTLGRFPWPFSLYGWRRSDRVTIDAAPFVPKSRHLNSVLVSDPRISVLAHNDYQKTKRNSAVYHLDHRGRLLEYEELNARGAHDLVATPHGILYSNSFGGTFDLQGKVLYRPSLKVYSRGIALHSDFHLCGGSVPTDRKNRQRTPLVVFFTDRNWREIGRLRVDEFRPGMWGGAVHEIMLP